MQTNQFLEDAKVYAIPGKYKVIFNFIGHILIYLLCGTIVIFMYRSFIDTSEEISSLRSFSIDHLFLLTVISVFMSGISNYFIYFRKGKSEKMQTKYLENLYEETKIELVGIARDLQLIRAVPEIASVYQAEQWYIDHLKKNIKKLSQINEALSTVD